MYERSNQLKDKLEKEASNLSFLTKTHMKKKPSQAHTLKEITPRKPAPLNEKRNHQTLNKENTLVKEKTSRPQSPLNIEEKSPEKRIKSDSKPTLRESGNNSNTPQIQQNRTLKAKKSVPPIPNEMPESNQTPIKEFRFRPDVAEILDFDKWADLKRIKEVIEDYMQKNLSYNSETQEYILIEGSNLQKILQVSVLKSDQFFKDFTKARCIISNSSGSHNPKISQAKEPTPSAIKTPPVLRTNNSECQQKDLSVSNQSRESSIASPTESRFSRKNSFNEVQTPNQPIPKLEKHKSENLKIDRKSSGDSSKTQKAPRKRSEISKFDDHKTSTDSGQFMENFFSKEDSKPKENKIKLDTASALAGIFSANKTGSSSKSTLGFVNKQDNLIFRKPMRWFSKINMQETEHYDPKTLMENLWPKNAEYLYQ